MPEGTEEIAPQDTAVAEPPQEEAPAAEPAQEAGPPDISDALTQMREEQRQILERLPEPQQENDPLDRFTGAFDQDAYEDDQGYEQGYEDPNAEQAEDPDAEIQRVIDERVQQAIEPVQMQYEMNRRIDAIESFAKENPAVVKDDAIRQATEKMISSVDPNFGRPGYAPAPALLRMAYFAAQAEAAQQSSQAPEGAEQAPAEAGGSQGPHLETGAGPGVQPEQMDPATRAYHEAFGGGPPTDSFGFPIQGP